MANRNHIQHRDQQQWGPNHQQMTPPWQRSGGSGWWRFGAWFAGAMFLHELIDNGGSVMDEPVWCLKVMLIAWVAKHTIQGVRSGRIPTRWLARLGAELRWWLGRQFVRHAPNRIFMLRASWRVRNRGYEPEIELSIAEQARAEITYRGGGAYLGTIEDGEEWVTAEGESAVMVLGPPRSGKTSAVMIPAILSAPGPVISTSTKPDVMSATGHARAEVGQVWLFDPAGTERELPDGVSELRWSPVAAAATWDDALVMARAMTATGNEHCHPARSPNSQTATASSYKAPPGASSRSPPGTATSRGRASQKHEAEPDSRPLGCSRVSVRRVT